MVVLRACKFPAPSLAYENKLAMHVSDHEAMGSPDHVTLQEKACVFAVVAVAEGMEPGQLGLTGYMRQDLQAALNDKFTVITYNADQTRDGLYSVNITVDLAKATDRAPADIDGAKFSEELTTRLMGRMFNDGQALLYDMYGCNMRLVVSTLEVPNLAGLAATGDMEENPGATKAATKGLIFAKTQIMLKKASGSTIKMKNVASAGKSLMKKDFNLADLNIGGLDSQFDTIFRRAFASRIFPTEVLESLGINHIRGILMYGPPGCGKTLMARQIGKMLDAREPKIVKGPEVLSKYVGESEKAIRELFADAEKDQAEKGDEADLHIIIFDEIDAICKARGSQKDGTGVHDTIVNQLLSKMDGVDAINNILIIGMTNRKDMLDQALLRPGRFECQLEITLPDEAGRRQVLEIHTKSMRKSGRLAPDVDINVLAEISKNFTGAELEGICKSAASHSMRRIIDPQALAKGVSADQLKLLIVNMDDFMLAFNEVKPMFGVSTESLDSKAPGGFISYGSAFDHNLDAGRRFTRQVARAGSTTKLFSLLLSGPPGSGKTALAAMLAKDEGFPLVRLISAEDYVGMGEQEKVMKIAAVFDEAYKSPLGCVVVDNIERLIDYVSIGPRFSNSVLQAILVSLKKFPPRADRRLMIIGTSSEPRLMRELGVDSGFDACLNIDELQEDAEVSQVINAKDVFANEDEAKAVAMTPLPISIKKLGMVIDIGLAGREQMGLTDYAEAISRFGLMPRTM